MRDASVFGSLAGSTAAGAGSWSLLRAPRPPCSTPPGAAWFLGAAPALLCYRVRPQNRLPALRAPSPPARVQRRCSASWRSGTAGWPGRTGSCSSCARGWTASPRSWAAHTLRWAQRPGSGGGQGALQPTGRPGMASSTGLGTPSVRQLAPQAAHASGCNTSSCEACTALRLLAVRACKWQACVYASAARAGTLCLAAGQLQAVHTPPARVCSRLSPGAAT